MKSDEYSWNYILTTPVSSYQLKYNELRRFILQVFLSALIIGLMVSFVLANKTFAPLKALMNMLEDFDSTDIKYLTSKNKNETAYIKDVIIHTQAENDTLQLELEQRLKKLNEAQIVMLQNQINPHFMYNTLDTISWAASDKLGVGNEVSDMITTLASLLRISLSRSSYLVSLDEEINHAKLYLKILRLRYKNKLTVHWSIDDDLSECKVLKLSLQPLIENAVNHGLRPKRYLGSIWISCKTIDDFIIISVEDDGVGMDESNIQLLNKQLRDNHPFDGNNVGIHNVNQRIRIIFGEEYGIYISGREQGLTVSIKCPLIR